MEHVTVYREAGRYAGWPANYGIWHWGDEIVVGFTRGYYQESAHFHARDRDRPFDTLQARSLDGGATWTVQPFPGTTPGGRGLSADEHMNPDLWVANALDGPGAPVDCPGGIQFTHPDFALMCARTGLRAGARSWFYISYDRCRSWQGPYWLPDFGQTGIAARTDYLVDGPERCTLFLTAAKPDGQEGRVFCARTTDGGRTFSFVSWVTPEPKGYTIMPASVRLPSGRILTAVRCSEGSSTTTSPHCWIDLYASDDDGVSWHRLSTPVPDAGRGGNPPTLTLLQGEAAGTHLCLTYGFRNPPFAMQAVLSEDGGRSWGPAITLRSGAGNHDIGYPRTVQRPDGTLVTVYYWNDRPDQERYIAATLWRI
ncbi:MAG: hypothetical protein KatS3mg050_0246 [Litorilinea sp.]|nr:MAG: hypothetical protein KatS3mg050_0246 [Litorilinea sp.]